MNRLVKNVDLIDIIDFDNQVDETLLRHYLSIIRAIRRNLWYNPDTSELITDSEFGKRLEKNLIRSYSTNSHHPIFGPISKYEKFLGPELVKFSLKVRKLAAATYQAIELLSDPISELVPIFMKIKSDTIRALCIGNSNLEQICSRRNLWEELWKLSYPNKNKISLPFISDLRSLWLELRTRNKSLTLTESFDKIPRNEDSIKGRGIRLAGSFGLIDGDIIVFTYPKAKRKMFVSQSLRGYEMIMLDPVLGTDKGKKLPDEAERILAIKGRSYWS